MGDISHAFVGLHDQTGDPINTGNPLPVQLSSGTSTSGTLIYRNINLITGASIKSSHGNIFGWVISNNASTARFLKFYNTATTPIVGTNTPVITIELPPLSTGQFSFSLGIPFSNGIGIGATVYVADSDTTAPNTNDVVVNIFYI